jgi:hypothetical protein
VTNGVAGAKKKLPKKYLFAIAGLAVVAVVVLIVVLTRGYSGDYPDQLLYDDTPITRFMQMTRAEFVSVFGPDRDGTSDQRYSGEHFFVMFSARNDKPMQIVFRDLDYVTFNGTHLGGRLMSQLSKTLYLPTIVVAPIANSIHEKYFGPGDNFFTYQKYDNYNDYAIDFITATDRGDGKEFSLYCVIYTREYADGNW